MDNKKLFHVLVGGALFIIGGCLHDFADIRDLGNFLAYGGMIYGGATTILILFEIIKNTIRDRANKKARKDLVDYKRLLDEGIITQSEFDSKASTLKKVIL
jgi:hypothetical protein